ncbi:hypothetical protein CPLU01_15239 [Colletotrichum plurivorum]|uniref:Uncharacterized protein n=1 Tax=Colletotrichum plurivorum TaxID=2175906 RepID=A0A8H6JCU2_9PEZI|nr:hypothetical protein CPLU01_15239 [Colletotrichum plurivorum]
MDVPKYHLLFTSGSEFLRVVKVATAGGRSSHRSIEKRDDAVPFLTLRRETQRVASPMTWRPFSKVSFDNTRPGKWQRVLHGDEIAPSLDRLLSHFFRCLNRLRESRIAWLACASVNNLFPAGRVTRSWARSGRYSVTMTSDWDETGRARREAGCDGRDAFGRTMQRSKEGVAKIGQLSEGKATGVEGNWGRAGSVRIDRQTGGQQHLAAQHWKSIHVVGESEGDG